jgi:hypothetical protein
VSAVLAAVLVAALVTAVAWLVSSPFRRPHGDEPAALLAGERRALEAARESKYAEIRDNETDYRTGKLSDQDYRTLDRTLRAEAVEILRAIDELDARSGSAAVAAR